MYRSRLPKIAAELPAKASAIEAATAERIAAAAKDRAPVGATGDLKESIEAKDNGVYAAWYWFFVEFGTVHSAAQPFMTPAAEEHSKDAQVIGRTILTGL